MKKLGIILAIVMVVGLVCFIGWAKAYDFSEEAEELSKYSRVIENNEIPPGYYTSLGYGDSVAIIEASEILTILRECLEYIPDGSDIEHEPFPPYVYHDLLYRENQPWTEPGPISKAQAEVDRLKRQTELHKKIKAIILQLEK